MEATSTRWNSRISFIFAASAAAIGLGNIWRFPFIAGANGGGAFVLTYLVCVIILGIPLLIGEIVLGRMGRQNPVRAMAILAKQSNTSRHWGILGGITVLAGFLILTYYVVIAGWVVDYSWRALMGQFTHITEISAAQDFASLQASHWQMLFTDTLVVAAMMAIIFFGIKRGLERAVLIMFPALLVLLFLLLGYAMTTDGFDDGLKFLFHPNFEHYTGKTVLLALGQAFFSLNIAMGITMMFSAYLPEETSVTEAAISVAIADTGFALLAGLIIFPMVFTYQLSPATGPSLIFKTLPLAFSKMPAGSAVASLFFIMLFFAAFSSVIALFEPAVCWLVENHHVNRGKAVLILGFIVWLISLGTIGSFSYKHDFSLFGVTFFQAIDFFTSAIMLPIGGLLIAIFSGWFLTKKLLSDELQWNLKSRAYRTWQWLLRYFAPICIVFILLMSFQII
jgi:neurotransmitter:Na+ symporter, NSS family